MPIKNADEKISRSLLGGYRVRDAIGRRPPVYHLTKPYRVNTGNPVSTYFILFLLRSPSPFACFWARPQYRGWHGHTRRSILTLASDTLLSLCSAVRPFCFPLCLWVSQHSGKARISVPSFVRFIFQLISILFSPRFPYRTRWWDAQTDFFVLTKEISFNKR